MDNHTKQLWFIGVGMLILGVIIGLMIGAGGSPADDDQSAQNRRPATTSAATTTDDGQADTADQSNSSDTQQPDRSAASTDGEWNGSRDSYFVSVSDQEAGESVVIDELTFDAPSWAAVREAEDGEMGSVLGAKWRPAGEYSDLDVSLLRGTEAGKMYYVTIYQDNGDKEFQHAADTLVDVDGRTVYTSFTAE